MFTMHICDNLVICSRINRGTIWSTMDLINANSIVWIHFFSFEWVDCQMKVTTSFENNQKVMIHCLIQLIIQSILLVLPFPWINIQKENRKFSKNRKKWHICIFHMGDRLFCIYISYMWTKPFIFKYYIFLLSFNFEYPYTSCKRVLTVINTQFPLHKCID